VSTRRLRNLSILALAIATLPFAMAVAPASAQGVFDFFFSEQRRYAPPSSARAYSDPNPQFNPFGFGSRPAEPPRERAPSTSGVAYCVRLCDGRFFPIQRMSGLDPAQTCNSFCPASKTKIFSGGGGIDHSVARDGTRYSDIENAFVYRTRIVADCTCNGKDPYGVATTSAVDDPTLRQGDIVATNNGFVAYTGGRRKNAEFAPIDSYSGLSAALRERLAGVRITPRNASPVTEEALHAFDHRRAQADR
jgi:hypothetical protein